jgi:hypothetical protein
MNRVTDTHVYFWGSELSNWHECKFRHKGLTFFNSEQAFMFEKALYFQDTDMAKKICETSNPSVAKKLGRQVKGFDTLKWSKVCYDIMVVVNMAKYSQSLILRNALMETEDRILVEASPYDTIWGVGLGAENDDILDENKWKGQNLLGKALMEVRENLK